MLLVACWRILSRRFHAVTVIHTSFCSAVLEVLWPLWSSASSATLWGLVWFDIQSVFAACTKHWDDVSCCKEEIMSIPATRAHASEKGCKREPSNKYPYYRAPCGWSSIPACRIEILVGVFDFYFECAISQDFIWKQRLGRVCCLGFIWRFTGEHFWKNGVRQQDFICELVGWPSLISFW